MSLHVYSKQLGEKIAKIEVLCLKIDITENHLLFLIKLLLFKIYITMNFKCKKVYVELLTEFFLCFLIQSDYCEKFKTKIYIIPLCQNTRY